MSARTLVHTHTSCAACHYGLTARHGSSTLLHHLIHTGWALSCGRAGLSTLCEGLAYLCYSHHSLDPPGRSDLYSTADLAAIEDANTLSLFATLQATVSACAEQHLLTALAQGILRVPYCEMDHGAFQRKLVWLSIQQPHLLHRLSCLPRLATASSSASSPVSCTSESLLSSLFLHVLFLFAVSGDDFFVLHCLTSLYALTQMRLRQPVDCQPCIPRRRHHNASPHRAVVCHGLKPSLSSQACPCITSIPFRVVHAAVYTGAFKAHWQHGSTC